MISINEIQSRLLQCLEMKTHVNKNLLVKQNFDFSLTGCVFCLSEIELAYLFLEVEKEFNVKINPNSIMNYEFNSINGIMTILNNSINLL